MNSAQCAVVRPSRRKEQRTLITQEKPIFADKKDKGVSKMGLKFSPPTAFAPTSRRSGGKIATGCGTPAYLNLFGVLKESGMTD